MPEWAQFSWWLWNGGRIPPAVQPAECWLVWSGLTASADVQEFLFWLDRGVLLLFRAQVHSSHNRFMGFGDAFHPLLFLLRAREGITPCLAAMCLPQLRF